MSIFSRNPKRLHNNPSTGDNRSPEIQPGPYPIQWPWLNRSLNRPGYGPNRLPEESGKDNSLRVDR